MRTTILSVSPIVSFGTNHETGHSPTNQYYRRGFPACIWGSSLLHPARETKGIMWIVRVALQRPYTFIVLGLLILFLSPVVILRTPTDIFPNINIPVIAVNWNYTGLDPEEIEGRLTQPYEKALTSLVDNIEHIESTNYNGQSVVKIFLQPSASLETANAQVTAASQFMLRQLPPGTLPPEIINFSASSVPILQLSLSGKGLSEQQLQDYATNYIRPQLVTVPGAVVPSPYGGKQPQVTVNMDQGAMQSKG